MITVKTSATEVWQQADGFEGMCEHVAKCAAICYHSKPHTGLAAVEFVQRLIEKGHGRALEFGTLVFSTEQVTNASCMPQEYVMDLRPFDCQAIMTNLRHVVENPSHYWSGKTWRELARLGSEHAGEYSKIFRPTIHYPTLARSIADELRTHTTLSTLMRSTRYVNANSGESNDIHFVTPTNAEHTLNETAEGIVHAALAYAERAYNSLLKLGIARQAARDILPLSVETEMVQCGYLRAWKNLVKVRNAPQAHPDAQYLAQCIDEAIDFNPA